MKTTFACPGCGASGSADASLEGRQVKCKHCGYRFAVPGPTGHDESGYALSDPAPKASSVGSSNPVEDRAVFVPTRSSEPLASTSHRTPKRKSSKKSQRDRPDFPWRTWLIRIAVSTAVILTLIALIAPGGVVIVGMTLLALGMVMVLVGWLAGAVGAFSEDSLYGFLYLLFPLYNAYYLVTRWDDLRRWFVCSTTGVGLVVLGTKMLQWAGVAD